jgi:hypothetical protein
MGKTVSNTDEVGISDYENWKSKKAIVPLSMVACITVAVESIAKARDKPHMNAILSTDYIQRF